MATNSPYLSLPIGGIPATGLFTAEKNVVDNTYDDVSGQPTDPPYNQTLIGDSSSNLVGSTTKPYLPIALPAYIPTIYQNIYDIQTNLTNIIPTSDVSSNRVYPTSYAVQQYVATILFGSEILTPDVSGGSQLINTGLTTTALVANENVGGGNVNASSETGITTYETYFGFDQIPSTKIGATKNVICISQLGEQSDGSFFTMTVDLSGNDGNGYFSVHGNSYYSYEFAQQGDNLTSLLFKDNSGNDVYYVTQYGGMFS